MKFKILGISASLRNARRGLGNASLIEDINSIGSEEELKTYITQEAEAHLQNFIEAGRKENKPFDEMYTDLKKLKGNKGLSNSEVALVSALWSAKELGAEIEHVSLSEYFSESKKSKNLDELKQKLREADGFLLSTPVYFGDRSSLSQSLVNLIRSDHQLRADMVGKVYAGIAVGAKRNGGQETALIYQLCDMIDCGLLGVGNDSDTTSQYGGTGHAGDVGTMQKDEYGLGTAMGTGRRIARVCGMIKMGQGYELNVKPKVLFWVLQDKDNLALNKVKELVQQFEGKIDATILDLMNKSVYRCIACDICPIEIDIDEVYRCIIKSPHDDLMPMHQDLLGYDAIIPVAYSSADRQGVLSTYQRFMERTRYFRRGDYVFSDLFTAPIVIEDIEANENLDIRMVTSMLRHHTIVAKPFKVALFNGSFLNWDSILEQFDDFVKLTRSLAASRIQTYSSKMENMKYRPVGYVLSARKDLEDEKLKKRRKMMDDRQSRYEDLANRVITKK